MMTSNNTLIERIKVVNNKFGRGLCLFNIFAFFFLLLLNISCKTPKSLGIGEDMYQGYKPIEPIPVKSVDIYIPSQNEFIQKPWASLSDSLIRTMLPNQSAQIALRKIEQSGKITYLPVSVSGEKGSYEVILDYMKYRIEEAADSVYYGNGRVGIGLRIKASLSTNKSNLNLSGLTNLGIEASKNNLSGFLSVDIIGIDSKDITNYLLIPAKLDETSIQNALQAISTIKSKIWDAGVILTPHLIAVNQAEKNSEWEIKQKVANVGEFGYTNNSEIIKNYWKPNGSINKANEEAIKNWIIHNIPGRTVSITFLLNTKEMEFYRKKIIQDLNLN